MNDGDVKTTQEDPDNIEKQIKATISRSFKIKGLTKRGERKDSQFNELYPKRDPDNGEADQKSSQEIKKTNEDTPADDHPQEISNCSHIFSELC